MALLPISADSAARSLSGQRTHHSTPNTLPLRLSIALAIVISVTSIAGVFVSGLYRDAPDWVAQIRGTDLVTLILAVPALVVSVRLSTGGSLRATIVWLGTLGYILYMYAIYAFDVAFNSLFLLYVASFALSLWSVVALSTRVNAQYIQRRMDSSLPVRRIACFLVLVAALFFLAWMAQLLPATAGNTAPTGLENLGLPTNPVHVLDLSAFLPLTALSGIWLWRRRPWGYVLSGALLTTTTLIGASIVSDSLFEHARDATVSLAMVPVFTAITLMALWLLISYLRHLDRPRKLGML